MIREKPQGTDPKAQKKPGVRASITFPPTPYKALEEIAQQNKASLAWEARDAAERYVAESVEAPRPGEG
jgi:hypothetical protein